MYWSVRTLLTTAVGCRTTFCSQGSCLLHQGSWECVAGVSWLTTSMSTSTSYTHSWLDLRHTQRRIPLTLEARQHCLKTQLTNGNARAYQEFRQRTSC
ncbi:hypothetical protein B0H14DRAFT_3039587 [Mycena olivaceomarginata]|nr:hypothetical protein B0H14DRAFT_3039587 [Mycena olivaceomarginata]